MLNAAFTSLVPVFKLSVLDKKFPPRMFKLSAFVSAPEAIVIEPFVALKVPPSELIAKSFVRLEILMFVRAALTIP